MTQEQKQLLLKDLCGRLPYHIMVEYRGANVDLTQYARSVKIENCKPYLRPISSMTVEEWLAYCDMSLEDEKLWIMAGKDRKFTSIQHKEDFLNSHHFDYRGLIEKGFALEAPENMYKTE